MEYHSKHFYDLKEETVIGEMQVLKRLGFHLTSLNPYGALANYLRILNLHDHPTIPQRAWNFCNDALLTTALALYPPTHIAAAAIYLACLPPPSSDQNNQPVMVLPMRPRPWWELFDVASEKEMWAVSSLLLAVVDRWGDGDDQTVWRKAAQLDLPLTKAAMKELLKNHTSNKG